METIANFERAFEIGYSCLEKMRINLVTPSGLLADRRFTPPDRRFTPPDRRFTPPPLDGPWEMSENALKNTLTYILRFLNHSCYMLCVEKSKHTMYKLETGRTSPFLETILYNETEKTKDYHIKDALLDRSGTLKNLRVMQCIVKPYSRTSTTTKEYVDILKDANLPDGVYILNLTDAVILRKDGKFPWEMVSTTGLPNEFLDNPFIPILSTSGQEGYWDIPIPNYDDVEIVLSGASPQFVTEWGMKTIEKAVFRGGPTGCGYTSKTNMRIKLAILGENPKNQSFLDAGIVGQPGNPTIDSKSIRFDPIYGLGYMKTGIKPVARMDMKGQSRHKYIIHIDGNVHAYRLLNTMRTGSLILRVKSDYTSWVDHLLEDGVHYISVKPDLSDLMDKIKYCKKNDALCMEIAMRGMEIANQLLTKPTVVDAFENILWEVYSRLNPEVSMSLSTNGEPIPSSLSSIRDSLPSSLSSIRDSLPSSLSSIREPTSTTISSISIVPVNEQSIPMEEIIDTIRVSPISPIKPTKKKTRKIKIVSDEEFFKNEDELKTTKRRRCPKGTRRNKIGNCEKIQRGELPRLRIVMKSLSRSPNPDRKLKIAMREQTPYRIPIELSQNSPLTKKNKRERCPKGTRKNKFGNCEKIKTKEPSPLPILVRPPSPILIQEPPLSNYSENKKNKRERCPNGTRRNKDGICVPKE